MNGNAQPSPLQAILIVLGIMGLVVGGFMLVNHKLIEDYPDTHAKALSYAESHPWATVTTVPGLSAAQLAAARPTGGGRATISTCTIPGQAAATSYNTTKPSKTKQVVNVAGTVTNTSTTPKDYIIEIAISAPVLSFGGASASVNGVPPGQTVHWTASGTISNHPNQEPTCSIQEVVGGASP